MEERDSLAQISIERLKRLIDFVDHPKLRMNIMHDTELMTDADSHSRAIMAILLTNAGDGPFPKENTVEMRDEAGRK